MGIDIIYKIMKVISCIIEIYLVYDFYSAFHRIRSIWEGKKRFVLSYIAVVIINIVINSFNSTMVNLCGILSLYLLIGVVIYEGNIVTWLRDWIIVAFAMFGAEFLFAILQQFAYNKPTNEIFANSFEMVFSIIGVELIKFMMLLLFKQMPKASEVKIEWKVFAAYFVMPLTMLLIMLQIPYLREESVLDESEDIRLIILFLLMLLGNLLLFYFFREYQNTKENELIQHVELTKYQEKLKFHEEIEILNEEHSVLIHNIKHYLKQIGNYAADSSNDEIMNVLNQLQIEVFDKNQDTICTNRLLNSILTDFKVNCQKHEIKAEILVEPECRIEFMKEIDALAMFGNLLDNALEAADKCEQGWVKVEMFRQNAGAILVLKIQNNYIAEIKESKGELISSKKEGKNHGIGVKSARKIVQKYNGIFDIEYGNGVFKVSAIFTN